MGAHDCPRNSIPPLADSAQFAQHVCPCPTVGRAVCCRLDCNVSCISVHSVVAHTAVGFVCTRAFDIHAPIGVQRDVQGVLDDNVVSTPATQRAVHEGSQYE